MTQEQRITSVALNRARDNQENAYAEVDEMLGTLNFASRKYEVRVTRIEPDTDENGVSCTGLLHTYKTKVSLEQIQQRFGGGTLEIVIWGPHPQTGKPSFIKRETVMIAGHPKPMPSFINKRDDESASATADVIRAFAESNERAQRRFTEVLEKNASAPSALTEILPVLQPIVEKLFAKSDETTKALIEAQRLEKAREDERRQAEREAAREEREREREAKAEERRLEEKKEERKREEERERRAEERRMEDRKEAERREREKEERELAREARELERERAKEDAIRLREEMREAAAEKQRQHERDLAAQQDRWKQEQQRAAEHAQMMQNFMQMNLDAMERKSESGGLESVTKQLLMLKDLNSTLTGEDREPSTMEKFQEGLQSMVTTLLPVGQQLKNAMGPKPAAPQQQQQQQVIPTPQRAVVVDLGPHRAALPPAQTTATTATQAPVAIPTQNPAPAQSDEIKNDLTEITIPKEAETDALTQAKILMKNVDLAVQRGMTAEQVVEEILNPFEDACPFIMNMASGLTEEQILEMVTSNVIDAEGQPLNWAILSPRGEELVSKAFRLWQEQGEE
jgi:hypothetical protein